jgi:hypothetical protein
MAPQPRARPFLFMRSPRASAALLTISGPPWPLGVSLPILGQRLGE